jgi:hypothetical protein
MNQITYASRNQLAGYFNLSQPDILALLVHSGHLIPEIHDGKITYKLGFDEPSVSKTMRGVQMFSVESVKGALLVLKVVSAPKPSLPTELPDEFMSFNQLSGLLAMGADSLRRRMRNAGLLKDSRNPSLSAPSSMYRMNDRTGFYQWNAKALHAALTKAGQL